MAKLTIIGMGTIGTSLGLAIKRTSIKLEIVGTDKERRNASKAESLGAVDRATGNLASAVEGAHVVIMSTPVSEMRDVLEVIGPRLIEGCLVTDTGDCKHAVMEWADRYLPRGVSFVGGNPMVSKPSSGPKAADGSIFKNRPYCVIPANGAQQHAVRQLTDMITSIGATPYFIDVVEHDSFVSAVRHLPILLSAALMGCTSKSPSWKDIAQMASTQYGELTRSASDDPGTNIGVFVGNSESTIHWIDAFIGELHHIREILAGAEESKMQDLEKFFNQTFEARNRWVTGAVESLSEAAASSERLPNAGEHMTDFFLGGSETRRRLFGLGGRRDRDDKPRK